MRLSLSTSSVSVFDPEQTFKLASELKYDGVEVMISPGKDSQDAKLLNSYVDKYQVPITSIHAPTLLLCKFVWGTHPGGKLRKSADFANEVNAEKVVVHPPMKMNSYANQFLAFSNFIQEQSGVKVCIENMFPWKVRGKLKDIYGPSWDETTQEANSLTLDFSHAAASSLDILEEFKKHHKKVEMIHLCDGSTRSFSKGDAIMDEHLIPGQGDMPIKEVYEFLNSVGWDSDTTLEVNTRKQKTLEAKAVLLEESIRYFRSVTEFSEEAK